MCKKERISHCKHGFYWTTRFPTKGERNIVDTEELRKLFDGSNASTITQDRLLTTLGVEPKGDTADVRDIHNMKFFIGRGLQYAKAWFEGKQSTVVSQVNIFVRNFFTFDIYLLMSLLDFSVKRFSPFTVPLWCQLGLENLFASSSGWGLLGVRGELQMCEHRTRQGLSQYNM